MATLEKSLRKVVTQDNALIEAAYGLTLNEKRLVLIGIGSVNPTVMPNKNEPLGFTVTVQDWLEAYPDSEAAYRDMQRAAKDLQSRSANFNQVRLDNESLPARHDGAIHIVRPPVHTATNQHSFDTVV